MKLSFRFMNRWEESIFDNNQQMEFKPVSTFMTGAIWVAAFVTLITLFVIMAFNNGTETDAMIALAVIFGIALLVVADKAFRNFRTFPSFGWKLGYAAYILAVFVVCVCLFTWLAGGIIMIYLFWIVIKAMLGGGNKKKATITYNDGSSEEATVEKGLMGETYYTGKDTGNEYMKY